jgi:integrase
MKARPKSLLQAIEEYLQYRHQLGFALKTEARALRGLGRYAAEIGHSGALTMELALQWARLPSSAAPLWWARRLEMARRFARFWIACDPETQVPPQGMFGPAYRRSPVHLYTATEITALLEATDILIPVGPIQALTCKTLLGLLACAGMRISEALSLQDEDFNWTTGTVTVRRSKFGRSRCLPLHPSALAPLRSYQKQRQNLHPRPAQPAFFLTLKGRPLSCSQMGKLFRRLRAHLGWKQTPLPRIHDLRHAFAIDCLMRWYRQGEDAGAKLLALATYLGHANIRHTYWYLSAVPELLALGSARLAAILEGGIDASR